MTYGRAQGLLTPTGVSGIDTRPVHVTDHEFVKWEDLNDHERHHALYLKMNAETNLRAQNNVLTAVIVVFSAVAIAIAGTFASENVAEIAIPLLAVISLTRLILNHIANMRSIHEYARPTNPGEL